MLIALENGDKMAIAAHLSEFKTRGVIDYKRALSIPTSERITALAQNNVDRARVLVALSASLKSAFNNINIRMGLSEDQIVDLADSIIDESADDNLSLEDVLLFLQQLVSGKAGVVNDRMDMPTFFKLFESYRQERHEALLAVRYEQQVNYKALGPTERASEDITSEKDAHRSALNEHIKHIYKDPK